MELKSGYTKEELNRFMQQAFREKQRIRRTPSGGWETFTPPHEPPQPQLQPPSPTSQPSQLSPPRPQATPTPIRSPHPLKASGNASATASASATPPKVNNP
jgi:hypothetical protein